MNCGSGEVTYEILTCGISAEDYADFIKLLLPYNPSFIGACCGSSPLHIEQIKRIIDERNCN
jgi:methionine synthase I (cobalamin-dependent)